MFVFLNLIAIAALVGIDQAIKLWAVQNLQPVGSMPLIPHVVELHFTYNEGMAFSLLWGRQEILIAATSIGMLLIAWWLFTHCRNDQLQRWALVLVLGGGIGNLIDRIAAGRVVDYINLLFMNFAVFNFADICVCVGMGLWVLSVILEERRTATPRARPARRKGTSDPWNSVSSPSKPRMPASGSTAFWPGRTPACPAARCRTSLRKATCWPTAGPPPKTAS